MSKQIKLKSLLKEGYAWERKPGKPLPTIQEVMDEFEAKQQKESIPPVPVQEVEDMSSKFWVVAKDKRGALYVFNDGYYNTKEEAEEALKNITVPKIVDANTIKVEPVPTSPNYTVLYDNLSDGSLEEKLNESIKHFKNPVNVAKLSLKDTLDLQRTAKIITESQYKKLLKEASFIDKAKTAVGMKLKVPETFNTEAINGQELTPNQKYVGNEIIMALNDVNKNMKDDRYITKLTASKLVDDGLVVYTVWHYTPRYVEEFQEILKSKGLNVSTKEEKSSQEYPDSDTNSWKTYTSHKVTMTVTKK